MLQVQAQPLIDKDSYIGFGKFYNLFFGIGIAIVLVLLGLVTYMGIKKYQKPNPTGVIYHMLIVQLFLSFRIFLVGLDFTFMYEQVDGAGDDKFACSFEGLYYYAFHLSEFLWSIVWLYDFILLSKRPSLFSGKYLLYYSCVVYFTSFGFSIVVYFQDQENFTSPANLMCYVNDNNSTGYYLLFNVPIILYYLMFIYVFFMYGLPILRSKPTKTQQPLDYRLSYISNSTTASNCIECDLVFTAIHPFVIIIVAIYAIGIKAQTLERSGKLKDAAELNASIGTELSNYSMSLSQDDIQANNKGGANQHEKNVKFRKAEQSAHSDMSTKIVSKDQLDTFREIIKHNVLENIVNGLQQTLVEKEKLKHFYDNKLGFGEAPANKILQQELQLNKDNKGMAMINKATDLIYLSKQGAAAQISNKDPNADTQAIEGLVLGHPDILRKFNQTMKQDEVDKFSKTEKVSSIQYQGLSYDFVELAPEIFHIIRQIQNIDERLIKQIFSIQNLENLVVDASLTKGGSFYVKPLQGGLIIKSINKAGYKLMQDFLPDYFRYTLMNPSTHLSPILGVFNMNLTKNGVQLPIYFTIQRNIQEFDPTSLENDDFAFGFDIKGSVHGRKMLDNPRDILNYEVVYRNKKLFAKTLKDQDFLQSFKKLDLNQSQSDKILSQLENDVNLLMTHGLMDYSMYLVIVIRPFKNVEYFIPKQIALKNESQNQIDEDKIHFTSIDSTSYKRFFIGEMNIAKHQHTRMYGRKEDSNILVMKERTRNKLMLYHICEPYDISSVQLYQEEKKRGEIMGNTPLNLMNQNSLYDQDPLRNATFQNRDKDSVASNYSAQNDPKQTAVFNAEISDLVQNQVQMIRQHSVVNFIKTTHSYEFYDDKKDEERPHHLQNQEQSQKRDQSFGHGTSNLVQRLNMFYTEKEKDDEIILDQKNPQKKMKACYVCKNLKTNHIVKEELNQDPDLLSDEIKMGVLNIARRDVIEQVVFDPQLGIVKREIHYGIIDYLTVSQIMKQYDHFRLIP
ncbi:phosphatidylinositol-4-phosphate 5-kinase [Stylonychia lemnae]|uniref:Phosphatidylinositol-4-phosphate 5-kinase n=1 Tax=Stylonychia lemnae TaxID=5949 RepID=A0A078AS44_STYLE|nr:phosphatidylinositol-4-phosphate 5-kinase [Stylonychia lemnae]|eukprot:CDW83708.1 phosphatidylinositol-4-phosphate 5-kinase [Stylonychia lemnae]